MLVHCVSIMSFLLTYMTQAISDTSDANYWTVFSQKMCREERLNAGLPSPASGGGTTKGIIPPRGIIGGRALMM